MSPKTKVSSVRLPLDLLNQAKERGLNLSQILIEALELRLNCSTPVVQNGAALPQPGTPHSLNNPAMLNTMVNQRVGSLARIGHEPPKLGFSFQSINWDGFREYCEEKYRGNWAKRVVRYAERYLELLGEPSGLERLTDGLRGNVLKSLTALSKYLGCYGEFKASVKACGIKWSKTSSVDSFLRIVGAADKSEDLLEWLRKARESIGKPSLALYLRYAALSGLRRSEAIHSFNLIIALSQERGGLESYYDREKGTLEHYKYPDTFLRTTKNVFFSLIPESLIEEIAASEPITYSMLKGRFYRRNMRMRVDELRDHWGTFMLDHGLKREEVDLLQGRIPKSVFVRHYWSPALLELRDRVFRALEQLRTELGDPS